MALRHQLGDDVDVDYKKAAENAAVAGLISGAAGYVYAKANMEPVSGEQNIYENAHALDRKINQHLSQDINENLQASSSLYEEIYNKQYEVFREYEEYAAQLKPVDYIDRLKGEFIDRGQKSGLSFSESLEAYRALESGEYERMARFFDTFSNEDKAVFWSGDLKAAIEYAESINGTVMEQTPGGNTFNNWEALNDVYLSNYWGTGKILDQKPIWKALSKQYAEGATGKVTYIHPDGYYGSVWSNVEEKALRELMKKGIVTEIDEVIINGNK